MKHIKGNGFTTKSQIDIHENLHAKYRKIIGSRVQEPKLFNIHIPESVVKSDYDKAYADAKHCIEAGFINV